MPDTVQQEAPTRETVGNYDGLDIRTLKGMKGAELTKVAVGLKVEGATSLRKQELIFKILQAQTEKSGLIFAEGVLALCLE